jgi:hypothetical protein
MSKWAKAAGGALGLLSGVLTALVGFSPTTDGESKHGRATGISDIMRRLGPQFGALVFLVVLLIGIVLGTTALLTLQSSWGWFDHDAVLQAASIERLSICIGVFLLVAGGIARVVDINKFSLHAMYGNRVVRAYLGASRIDRDPNPFTGFDPKDNFGMDGLKAGRPLHVVNIALNLVRGSNLAWQQRQAESFTVTRLHSGNRSLGYRQSKKYGGENGISIGKAIAISGAAASPNMGYHSSPPVTFLMALFNARLGWWLGNPAKSTFKKAGPNFAVAPLIAEAFGLTDNDSDYVYLSDGGHFENLGLYEMVLRRCRFIVVSDAGCDPACSFEDLGGAIRKIRIDLGIPIEFEGIKITSRLQKTNGRRCAIANIGYSHVDGKDTDGVLIYLKPSFYGDEPTDIINYALGNLEFPHEPTSDQWFSESQFESYRMLGVHTIEEICRNHSTMNSLQDFERAARIYVGS